MAYPKEVRDTFEEIVADNNSVISKLDSAIADARHNRAQVDEEYADAVSRFVESLLLPLDKPALAKLSALRIGGGFEEEITARKNATVSALQQMNALTMIHGDENVLVEKIGQMDGKVTAAQLTVDTYKQSIAGMDKVLSDAEAFNKKAEVKGKPQLNEKEIDYFSSKYGFGHLMAVCFNGHYRRGRKIIGNFKAEDNATIPVYVKKRALLQEQLDTYKAELAGHKTEADAVKSVFRNLKSLSDSLEPDDKILSDVGAKIIDFLARPDNFGKTARALGERFPQELIENRAKIESLKQIETGLNLRRDSLKKASSQLSDKLPKLKKAVSNGVRKDIKVDLPKLKKQFKAQQVMATHAAVEMRKATRKVRSFSAAKARPLPSTASVPAQNVTYVNNSAGFDPLSFMMGWMVFDMISHDHGAAAAVDSHAVNSVIGISDTVASEANIDTAALSPEFSSELGQELGGLSGDFNIESGALDNLDIGTIDTGSFNVDVSVPDISIDTGGSFGGDFGGGGGGFDSGGFGGGFD